MTPVAEISWPIEMQNKPPSSMTYITSGFARTVAAVALTVGCHLHGDILPDPSSPVVTPSGSYYEWRYEIQILRGTFVDPSIPAGFDRPFDGVILYDVQGFVPGSAEIRDVVTGELLSGPTGGWRVLDPAPNTYPVPSGGYLMVRDTPLHPDLVSQYGFGPRVDGGRTEPTVWVALSFLSYVAERGMPGNNWLSFGLSSATGSSVYFLHQVFVPVPEASTFLPIVGVGIGALAYTLRRRRLRCL